MRTITKTVSSDAGSVTFTFSSDTQDFEEFLEEAASFEVLHDEQVASAQDGSPKAE